MGLGSRTREERSIPALKPKARIGGRKGQGKREGTRKTDLDNEMMPTMTSSKMLTDAVGTKMKQEKANPPTYFILFYFSIFLLDYRE